MSMMAMLEKILCVRIPLPQQTSSVATATQQALLHTSTSWSGVEASLRRELDAWSGEFDASLFATKNVVYVEHASLALCKRLAEQLVDKAVSQATSVATKIPACPARPLMKPLAEIAVRVARRPLNSGAAKPLSHAAPVPSSDPDSVLDSASDFESATAPDVSVHCHDLHDHHHHSLVAALPLSELPGLDDGSSPASEIDSDYSAVLESGYSSNSSSTSSISSTSSMSSGVSITPSLVSDTSSISHFSSSHLPALLACIESKGTPHFPSPSRFPSFPRWSLAGLPLWSDELTDDEDGASFGPSLVSDESSINQYLDMPPLAPNNDTSPCPCLSDGDGDGDGEMKDIKEMNDLRKSFYALYRVYLGESKILGMHPWGDDESVTWADVEADVDTFELTHLTGIVQFINEHGVAAADQFDCFELEVIEASYSEAEAEAVLTTVHQAKEEAGAEEEDEDDEDDEDEEDEEDEDRVIETNYSEEEPRVPLKFCMLGDGESSRKSSKAKFKALRKYFDALYRVYSGESKVLGMHPWTHDESVTWTDVEADAKDFELTEILGWVQFINQHGETAPGMLDHFEDEVINSNYSQEEEDVIFTTVHQAKGLEWDRAQVLPDLAPVGLGGGGWLVVLENAEDGEDGEDGDYMVVAAGGLGEEE